MIRSEYLSNLDVHRLRVRIWALRWDIRNEILRDFTKAQAMGYGPRRDAALAPIIRRVARTEAMHGTPRGPAVELWTR